MFKECWEPTLTKNVLKINKESSPCQAVKLATHDRKVWGSIPARVEKNLLGSNRMLDVCSRITS